MRVALQGALLATTCLVQCSAWSSQLRSSGALFSRPVVSRLNPAICGRERQTPSYLRMVASRESGTQGLATSGDKVSYVFDVFIEDTDCFGVVYNANYLKFFDRARQSALGPPEVVPLPSVIER